MKLRFNLGAIVELNLLPFPESQKITGKVISVTPDEVEVCPQLRVHRNIIEYDRLDTTVSADAQYTIHIKRKLIAHWSYAKVVSLNNLGVSVKDKTSLFLGPYDVTIDDCTLNHYDSNGFFKGHGPYCGDIEEEDSTIIIINPDIKNFNDCN